MPTNDLATEKRRVTSAKKREVWSSVVYCTGLGLLNGIRRRTNVLLKVVRKIKKIQLVAKHNMACSLVKSESCVF